MSAIKQQMSRWMALLLIGISVLFALSLWFSATAVLSQLQMKWSLTSAESSSITTAVQIGFIVGALGITWTKLADRWNSRWLFSVSAIIGAVSNGAFILSTAFEIGLLFRFLTGAALAGVYPTAVRLVSDWFENRRGTAVGVIIGALTIGSAMPHLIKIFFASLQWQIVILASSILAIFAACIIYFLLPDVKGRTASLNNVKGSSIQLVIKNRPVMLVNYGYFGHTWELYAMWTWLPLFLVETMKASGLQHDPQFWGGFLAFAIIGLSGAFGAIAGGVLADKMGKARLAKWAMIVSASCAVLIGFTFGKSIWLTVVIGFIWGASIIADSAQFSALATEYAQPSIVGSALTFQMAVGFFITVVSIYLLPPFVIVVGWQWAFALLAIGPLLGIFAMNLLIREDRGKLIG